MRTTDVCFHWSECWFILLYIYRFLHDKLCVDEGALIGSGAADSIAACYNKCRQDSGGDNLTCRFFGFTQPGSTVSVQSGLYYSEFSVQTVICRQY